MKKFGIKIALIVLVIGLIFLLASFIFTKKEKSNNNDWILLHGEKFELKDSKKEGLEIEYKNGSIYDKPSNNIYKYNFSYPSYVNLEQIGIFSEIYSGNGLTINYKTSKINDINKYIKDYYENNKKIYKNVFVEKEKLKSLNYKSFVLLTHLKNKKNNNNDFYGEELILFVENDGYYFELHYFIFNNSFTKEEINKYINSMTVEKKDSMDICNNSNGNYVCSFKYSNENKNDNKLNIIVDSNKYNYVEPMNSNHYTYHFVNRNNNKEEIAVKVMYDKGSNLKKTYTEIYSVNGKKETVSINDKEYDKYTYKNNDKYAAYIYEINEHVAISISIKSENSLDEVVKDFMNVNIE